MKKTNVINDIYYNEAGYGSVKTTYAGARLQDNKNHFKLCSGVVFEERRKY